MPATLFTDADLTPRFNNLFDFIQGSFEIARRARKLATDPESSDALTLDQTNPVAEEGNIAKVEERAKKIKDLLVKVDDAMSEMTFAIEFMKDRARRKPALPIAIHGPPFGTVTTEAP